MFPRFLFAESAQCRSFGHAAGSIAASDLAAILSHELHQNCPGFSEALANKIQPPSFSKKT
jgi:hypothetical protein